MDRARLRSEGASGLKKAVPFFEAAARGGEGVVRIERKKHELVERLFLQCADRFLCVGMPVTHRYGGRDGDVRAQGSFQGSSLLLRKAPNWRAAADVGVVMADSLGPTARDDTGQGFACEEGAGKIDDVRVAEQIVEERLDS